MHKKKIGIWGFGKVGKSLAKFYISYTDDIEIMDKTTPSTEDMCWLHKHDISFCLEEDYVNFFARNDVVVPSPGIDIRNHYHNYKKKWQSELDLFATYFHKSIIAITGTVGKTTITHIISKLLNAYKKPTLACGNIGTPMLSIIDQQDALAYAVAEISSFQLEYTKKFAPDLAIITNFSPNHLDRHSLEEYFLAKSNITLHQGENQQALVPIEIAHKLRVITARESPLHIFSHNRPSEEEMQKLVPDDTLFFVENNQLRKINYQTHECLLDLNLLPPITFVENWMIICSTLHILGCDLSKVAEYAQYISLPEHRMERIIYNGSRGIITCINDSKSTTVESTRAAVRMLKGKSIILLLGGLGKGVDRTPLIAELKNQVKSIYCFGKERQELHDACITYGIPSHAFAILDDAYAACIESAENNDYILLSPAGSSYDEFQNYEARGNHFKKLVREFSNDSAQKNK